MAITLPRPVRPNAARPASARGRAYRQWLAGQGHAARKQWPNAATAFEQASTLDADITYALAAAHALIQAGRNEEAASRSRKARLRWPNHTLAYTLESHALLSLGRAQDSIACLEQLAPDAAPDHAYWSIFGKALQQLGRHEQAISALMNAVTHDVADAPTHFRLGLSFKELGLKEQAAECIRTSLLLGLGSSELAARGVLALLERDACVWSAAHETMNELSRQLCDADGDAPLETAPFAHAVLSGDPLEHLKVARLYARHKARGVRPLPRRGAARRRGRLRVGYLSSDFHQHATSQLIVQMLECHDRDTFEVTLISTGPDADSGMRRRIRAACERFEDLRGAAFDAVARRIRELEIDILVDLKGGTFDTPFQVMAYRAAALQVSWLGYPGSSGADFIDYVIGDRIVTPLDDAAHFSEKIAQLPHCYQPNDSTRALPSPSTRGHWDVPQEALVLCGFHQTYKISDEVFDTWCAVLRQRPDAVLWLLRWNLNVESALCEAARARDIDSRRLVFAPVLPLEQHLSRLACADIFLDTWPCNAHTTAGEALWCGVPVVTLRGATFAQRVAASLLHTVGLDELVCSDRDAYQAEVLALCDNASRRRAVGDHLRALRDSNPLFDGRRFARDIEALYLRMWERASSGLPPAHLPAQAVVDGRG